MVLELRHFSKNRVSQMNVCAVLLIGVLVVLLLKKQRQLHEKNALIKSLEHAELECRLANEEAEILQRQLFQAQKLDSLGQLTSGIAHDFNNILMGISGYTTLAMLMNEKNARNPNQEKITTYLQGIEDCNEKAADLVKKMLIYCRQNDEPDTIEIEPSEVIFQQIMEMLRSTISRCIELDFIPNEVPNIIIDQTQLHQIIVNLVINSRDAIESVGNRVGKITVSLSFEYFDCRCDACFKHIHSWFVVISVSDNGTGIDATYIPHIFDPFFTTKEIGKGTGLGLSIVSGIVRQAGGHILVDSDVGNGTRFRVLFPPANALNLPTHSRQT